MATKSGSLRAGKVFIKEAKSFAIIWLTKSELAFNTLAYFSLRESSITAVCGFGFTGVVMAGVVCFVSVVVCFVTVAVFLVVSTGAGYFFNKPSMNDPDT